MMSDEECVFDDAINIAFVLKDADARGYLRPAADNSCVRK
jgi:hypothetical protein